MKSQNPEGRVLKGPHTSVESSVRSAEAILLIAVQHASAPLAVQNDTTPRARATAYQAYTDSWNDRDTNNVRSKQRHMHNTRTKQTTRQ
ncbi:hypothetical protein NDU88_002630 [Pleurodeles waltl]|uniref:Uncharacterized protein n=1 Tax=Pleurodeles waltl TaxID=8319 RepID=A0AAV7M1I5_PLEWA|nr:hypothetical protein NDU88_002630 [Pleurodeles waltl]